MNNLTLAHLSDLHFGCVDYSFKQFLSKKWIGNFNYLLFRKSSFSPRDLNLLTPIFKSLNVETLFFTGDFSTTSSENEFLAAKEFLKQFDIPNFLMPGNHDCYTKECEIQQSYYQHFSTEQGIGGFSLQKDRVYCRKIKPRFFGISLDCAVATPPFNAYGIFFPKMEEKLEIILNSIPKEDTVIMGNHFPLFPSNRPSHDLRNSKALQALLKRWPNIKLYLHGHDHKPYIIDKRSEGYPLVLNSGSSALLRKGGFYICEFMDKEIQVSHYFCDKEKGWYPEKRMSYFL